MSNKTFRIAMPVWFAIKRRAAAQAEAAGNVKTSGVQTAQDEATFQAYIASAWEAQRGMSVGGWGWPW